MAKFSIRSVLSRKQSVPNTINSEGGRAFTQTAKLEPASVLVTTFLEGEFYRTEKDTVSLLVGASDSSTKLDRKRIRQKLREMTESSWAIVRDALVAELGPLDDTAA